MIDIFLPHYRSDINETYYLVTYYLESTTTLKDAAWNLAIGQSIGNPNNRSEYETEQLLKTHTCLILNDPIELEKKKEGIVTIAFPEININFFEDGVTSLLVQIMGGQCDIDIIQKCVVKEIKYTPKMYNLFKKPKFGLEYMKRFCNVPSNNVLLGGIIKPKVGLSPEKYLDLVKQFIDNGCNFIKEDEILSNQSFCPIEKRVEYISNYIRSTSSKVFYCVSIQSDPHKLFDNVKKVVNCGGNGIHINFHSGLGIYKSIREMDLPILMHFQKSGDKLINCDRHKYYIEQSVIFQLVALSGCDTLHIGMIGGYSTSNETEMTNIISMLNKIGAVPALSCGMHPGLIKHITNIIGHSNWMANCGGAITSHPMGTVSGINAMKQSISGNYGIEYYEAIKKWGLKD